MMDAGHAVGRGGTLEEHERLAPFAQLDAAAEQIIGIPLREDFLVYFGQIEFVVFGKLHFVGFYL